VILDWHIDDRKYRKIEVEDYKPKNTNLECEKQLFEII
jgi:hypothetical protein